MFILQACRFVENNGRAGESDSKRLFLPRMATSLSSSPSMMPGIPAGGCSPAVSCVMVVPALTVRRSSLVKLAILALSKSSADRLWRHDVAKRRECLFADG
jgi:hypothetical protein